MPAQRAYARSPYVAEPWGCARGYCFNSKPPRRRNYLLPLLPPAKLPTRPAELSTSPDRATRPSPTAHCRQLHRRNGPLDCLACRRTYRRHAPPGRLLRPRTAGYVVWHVGVHIAAAPGPKWRRGNRVSSPFSDRNGKPVRGPFSYLKKLVKGGGPHVFYCPGKARVVFLRIDTLSQIFRGA